MEGGTDPVDSINYSSLDPEIRNLSLETDAKIFLKRLRHDLIRLQVPNMQSHILSQLLIYGDSTVSQLQLSITNKGEFFYTLDQLQSTHCITKYVSENRGGRKITYVKLNSSGRRIYERISLKNSKNISQLIHLFERLNEELSKNQDFNKIASLLMGIGFEKNTSNLLVYLYYHQKPSMNDIRSAINLGYSETMSRIRHLYSAGYIRGSDIGYSLAKPLADIGLEYISQYAESIALALNEVKYIIYLTENTEVKVRSHYQNRAYAPNVSMEYVERIQEKHRDISNAFISGIQDLVIDKGSTYLPLELVTTIPLPPKLRVYLYELRAPTWNTATSPQYKMNIHIPEQMNEPAFTLDDSDDAFILLGGYDPRLQVFVFWDAYRHLQLKKHCSLSVRPNLISDVLASEGGYIHKKWNKRTDEYLIISRVDSLRGALKKIYESHIDDLMEERHTS